MNFSNVVVSVIFFLFAHVNLSKNPFLLNIQHSEILYIYAQRKWVMLTENSALTVYSISKDEVIDDS